LPGGYLSGYSTDPTVVDAGGYQWPDQSMETGICHFTSMIRLAEITDGASNTYCVGEKCVDPDHYFDSMSSGDDGPWNEGYDVGWLRWGNDPPRQDTPGANAQYAFGSPHSGSLNMAMCDGSVASISYAIDSNSDPNNPGVHQRLSNRHDGIPISGNAW
jgi:prepilin-type processing-associated H-X9-DG protein